MRAVKGNKEYMIDESQQKGYQDAGFDILDDDGNVIAFGRGKTVSYDDHMKAVKEIGKLQELAAERSAEIEALKAENEQLKVASMQEKRAGTKKAGE